MQSEIVNLAKKLIAIPSTCANSEKLDEVLQIAASVLTDFKPSVFNSNKKPSLLFSNQGNRQVKYKIILNAHLDVVDGRSEQFQPFEEGGRLYGRGAYDMKSTAAVMILLFREIAGKAGYPLGLQITTDEEVGGEDGTGLQIKRGVAADFAITGEGTNFNIIHESKVRILLKLKARGKTSHGAYPWLGENAIFKMQEAIQRIHGAYPTPKEEWEGTTVNVTTINSNNTEDNKTPDLCEATLDIRAVPDESDLIVDSIKKITGNDIDVETVMASDGHKTDPDNGFIKKLLSCSGDVLDRETKLKRAHGTSDARYYTAAGFDGVEFGPIGANHHADNEWVDIASLSDYYEILKKFLIS